jgi:sporulation protein YlmC with PRC-barrel domain
MKATISVALAAAVLTSAALAQTPAERPGGAIGQFLAVQPEGQWSARVLLGQPVINPSGEAIGDVDDVLFDKSGRIVTAVIGVGGFLGIGEKAVAVPYELLTYSRDAEGKRVISVPLSKEALEAAPSYQPTEKTPYMRAREQAVEMGRKAIDKASELSDKAAKKLEEWMAEQKK